MNVHRNETSKQKKKIFRQLTVYEYIFLFYIFLFVLKWQKNLSLENSTERSIRINPRDCSIDVDCERTYLNIPSSKIHPNS